LRALCLTCLFVAAAAIGAAAQTPITVAPAATISGVTVTDAGTYTGVSKSATAEAGQQSPTRTVGTLSDWRFASDSTDIDGKVGTQFGVEFRVDGAPAGDSVTLYLTLTFPPQGIRNPNTGETLHGATIALPNAKIGARCLIGYGFDNAWEIVPGPWTLQVWYQNRMLAERTFTVSKAE